MIKKTQNKTFKYLKNRSSNRGDNLPRKMPNNLKYLTKLYRELTIEDLKNLQYICRKDYNKLNAIRFALSGKSYGSDKYRRIIDRTYIPENNRVDYNFLDGGIIVSEED